MTQINWAEIDPAYNFFTIDLLGRQFLTNQEPHVGGSTKYGFHLKEHGPIKSFGRSGPREKVYIEKREAA